MPSSDRTVLEQYAARLTAAINAVARDEAEAINRAAGVIADQLRRDGLIYVYGPGAHSAIAVQDVFYRAGCPANVVPISDTGTTLAAGALASTQAERATNHGSTVIAASGISPGDPLIIVNAFGINAAALNAARTARSLGAQVIALTTPAATAALPADHPARAEPTTTLADLADIHVDTHVPTADALLELTPTLRVAGASTVLNSFALHAILATAVDQARTTTVWRSTYTPGADTHNAQTAARYRPRIPHL
ncbi:sugar isomerase domain-containing protein [Kribbella sp. NPDC005582]|uniref:sugar isomerase domain-containing protein n=1 Tax=Kribbella sp. NPDC005582 TaxID=3156893 RepID=UPI0033AB93B2